MILSHKAKSKVVWLMALVYFCLTGFAWAETFEAFTGKINAKGINVRVDSTVGSEIICSLAQGESVEVIREVYGWYKIRLPKEAPAYIKKILVECNSSNLDPVSQMSKCQSAKVMRDSVNIRLRPNESAWILGKVDKATVVNVISDDGAWYKIYPVDQSYGWVNKKFVDKTEQETASPAPQKAEALN